MASTSGLHTLLGSTSSSRHRRAHYGNLNPRASNNDSISTTNILMGTESPWSLAKQMPLRFVLGIALLTAAVVLLVWNEGDAVRMSQSLDEGYDMVVSLPTADLVSPSNEGKVVHISGALLTFPPLSDFQYNVEIDAVRLKRRVQMLQWIEEEETRPESSGGTPMNSESSPGSVSYSYSKTWKDKLINSNLFSMPFGHENPTLFPLQSEIRTADVVKIGSYLLSPEIVETFNSYQSFSGDEEPDGENVKLHAGMYYETKDIFNPEVGDFRVQFYYAGHAGDTYTLIGTQKDSTIVPYISSSGQELVLLHLGQRSPEQVFATHHTHTRLQNWAIRILGFVKLCAAITVMHPVVYAIVGEVRVLRDVAAMSGGHFTLTVAMSLSLAIVALAWCVYRPAMAVCLVLLAALPAIKTGYYGGGNTTRNRALRR